MKERHIICEKIFLSSIFTCFAVTELSSPSNQKIFYHNSKTEPAESFWSKYSKLLFFAPRNCILPPRTISIKLSQL